MFKKLLLWVATGFSLGALGQEGSVGINTTNPNDRAVLELVSPGNDQGFLVPRLSTIERLAMSQAAENPLSNEDNGLMVYDRDQGTFYFWRNGQWVAGLGVLSTAQAGGDLTGDFPNPFIRPQAITDLKIQDGAVTEDKIRNSAVTENKLSTDAVSTDKIINGAVTGNKLEDIDAISPGTFGNQFSVLRLSVDKKGRVQGLVETSILITSENIEDLSLLNQDIAEGTITISKIDPQGLNDRVLAINSGGQVFWESRANFVSSFLPTNSIFIGNDENVAQGLPVAGDITALNNGTADLQINQDAVTTFEILNETIAAQDIATDAVTSDEIAADAVGTSEIENLSIQTEDISNSAVDKDKINEDVAGLGLSKNLTDGSLQVNLGNGITFNQDTLVADLEAIAGDGLVEDDGVLDVNVDNTTLETNADIVRIKAEGVGNNELALNAVTSDKILDNEVSSADIADGTIVDVDVKADAAIAGTKINPDFGNQDVSTTGSITGSTLTDGDFATTAGVVTGVNSIDIDNLNIDGNTISSTNTDGQIILNPEGAGIVNVSTSLISNVIDPVGPQDAATKNYVDTEISNSITADNGVTENPDGNIQLGGDLIIPTEIGVETGTSLTISDAAGNATVSFDENGNIVAGDGNITTGAGQVVLGGNVDANNGVDVSGAALTIDNQAITQTTGGQVTFAGNVDAGDGVDVTSGDLTVADNTDLNGTLDVAGQTDLATAGTATNIRGSLDVAESANIDGNLDVNDGLDVTSGDLNVAENAT
ncbi:MAG: hypothetical protein AAF616_06075, partial [Bacteroidota bacterium]